MKKQSAVPIQVANGVQVFTLGTADFSMLLNGKKVKHPAHVMETTAFDAVLGLDFLSTPPCEGVLTSPEPCRLLYG